MLQNGLAFYSLVKLNQISRSAVFSSTSTIILTNAWQRHLLNTLHNISHTFFCDLLGEVIFLFLAALWKNNFFKFFNVCSKTFVLVISKDHWSERSLLSLSELSEQYHFKSCLKVKVSKILSANYAHFMKQY